MRTPIFVRALSDEERATLKTGLRSSDGVLVRRCQMVLASARGERAPQIAVLVGCDEKTVRQLLHRFNRQGRAALPRGSSRPHQPPPRAFPGERAEQLRALLHRRPARLRPSHQLVDAGPRRRGEFRPRSDRPPGDGRSHPADLATARHQLETRQALDHQPRPGVRTKKSRRDRRIALTQAHPTWALGFADEVWWSRLAQPHLHAWAEEERPLRLVEQTVAKADPDPKALACYGLLWPARTPCWPGGSGLAALCPGRPVSAITIQFLEWCCLKLAALGVPVWALIWDNASWHVSKAVRAWIRTHNRAVKQEGQGVRILACYLPVKSPWLNPIEPKWNHSKRAIVEPTRLLSAQELADRVCAYHRCPHEPHLSLPDPIQDKADLIVQLEAVEELGSSRPSPE